jgi:cell division protein FtsN
MERKMADSEDWIKNRAYELWEQDGQPHGKDAEHWEQARLEYEQRSKRSAGNGAKQPSARQKSAVKPEPASTDPSIDTAPAAKPKAKTASKAAAKPAAPAKKRTGKPSAS